MRLSAAPGAFSPRRPRSAGRAIANGSVVWHEMQKVPRSRAAFGQVAQKVARSSRYDAAALGSQPGASAGAAPRATAPGAPKATMARVTIPNAIGTPRYSFIGISPRTDVTIRVTWTRVTLEAAMAGVPGSRPGVAWM